MTIYTIWYIYTRLVSVNQWYTLTTGVIFSSDVSKLVTNTLPLLLQLLGGISKLVVHTSATTVLQVVSVNYSHAPKSITQLLQLIPLVNSIDNATVFLNNSINNALNNTMNSNNSNWIPTECLTFNARPWLLCIY